MPELDSPPHPPQPYIKARVRNSEIRVRNSAIRVDSLSLVLIELYTSDADDSTTVGVGILV